jgi:hypothetical protein
VSQDRHQEPGRHRFDAGDAQPARAAPAHPFADLYSLSGSVSRHPRLFSSGAAGCGHPYPTPEALDHRNPQLPFQRRNLVGDGGLRHVQRRRGLAHRTVIHQRDRAFERYAPSPAYVMPLTTRQGRIHQYPGGMSRLAAFNGFGHTLGDKPMPFGRNVIRRR